MEQTNLMPNIQ